MVETDWREILSFSQRELAQADKERLCDSLSWMEADDIELNFSDLKTLFRLAQDIMKFKSEQVNNLMGQLETAQRKIGKGKFKSTYMESPTRSSDDVLETIAHQEEVIKANKEILEQLYADIAKLEGRKGKLEEDRNNFDRDSESSRDALSEMNAMAELENELSKKNRHIRKLLADVKVLEEENAKLKEKVSVLKDKLTEATGVIENLTEQLFSINSENNHLKETLGKTEKLKANMSIEIESLRKDIFEKESARENIYEEIKVKVQHWKNLARAKKTEVEVLTNENEKLRNDIQQALQSQQSSPKTKVNQAEELKIKELQEKLTEASNEILKSANIIELLKAENKQLRTPLEETPDFSVSDAKNESDDGKERAIINKLKKKVKSLTIDLKAAEEMVAGREKELTEITSQLQLLKSDEGINALLEGLKSKKRKLKMKDVGIKSLVQEVNSLSQLVDDLQLQNESMRQQLNIPVDEKISTKGILKKYRDVEQNNVQLTKDLRKIENKLISIELDNRMLRSKINKLFNKLNEMGCDPEKLDEDCQTTDSEEEPMPTDGGGEASTILGKSFHKKSKNDQEKREQEMKAISEENEGLRKGLQEILEFLKDNSETTSGILALECPSLETVLHSMEARHAAGWFAPHMTTVMELKAALGGKDALLTALHEARKETFDVMNKLSKETERSRELEKKLNDVESSQTKTQTDMPNASIGEFGTWMSENEQTVPDLNDKNAIKDIIKRGNMIYENQLKNGLIYFHNKFKTLFDKMTSIAVQTADDQSKWSIQEEKYKAEIENLKALLSQNEEEDISDMSPGVINVPNVGYLQRKCSYLEEAYKYIRTLNENMKNEYLETKRDAMITATDYEAEMQKLILAVAKLTDKLRCSISIDLFWKQNEALNEVSTKYRKIIEVEVQRKTEKNNLYNRLEADKVEIINNFQKILLVNETKDDDKLKSIMSNIEQSIFSKQLQEVCSELDQRNTQIETLQAKILELQEAQSKLIDETLGSTTKEDINLTKEQLDKLVEENKVLKEQCQHVESQLDIALLQLQDSQQRQMSNDMEINMLRHQILDLQSVGDSKAIVARLSGEVLVAHLQASESYKKIERLSASLHKEKQLRVEAEEMLKARQKIYEVYAYRYETKFRYMYEVMQVLRQQYQGCLPIASLENYLNNVEDLTRKNYDVNEKLEEIEDLHCSLIAKHSVFDQILDVSKNKCIEDEDNCSHKLQNLYLQGVHSREIDHCKKKLKVLEQSREEILKRCNYLEKTLVLINQGFEKSLDNIVERRSSIDQDNELEIEDVQSDNESDVRRSETITLPKPQVLRPPKNGVDLNKFDTQENSLDNILLGSPIKTPKDIPTLEVVNVFVQTSTPETPKTFKIIQTEEDRESINLRNFIRNLEIEIQHKERELSEAMKRIHERSEEILSINADKLQLESKIQSLQETAYQKDKTIDSLHATVDVLRKQIDDYKNMYDTERFRTKEAASEDNKTLITALKQFENDKNAIINEYKELFAKEREEYAQSVNSLQIKISELQSQLDRQSSETSAVKTDALKEANSKYTVKISDLEDKCFKLQSDFDACKAELITYKSEVDRWKDLAIERLAKMEQLGSQLEERHCHEVESYKAETEHWLSQLNETQREHNELRSRLTEQKAAYVKQLAEKDTQIEQLRSVIHGLKTQIISMQTMMSIADPGFDLSAIVEAGEGAGGAGGGGAGGSDASARASPDRLELKYASSNDLQDLPDDMRVSTSSTSVWQEPALERLRREKALLGKQNALLRRHVRALAARERRARLDAMNLKNQLFRISTTGNKVATAETAALHNKINSLQAQLLSARRDTHSTVALWDKWKRAQQTAERWQARFEEKCQEARKLEADAARARAAVARLHKEKKVLLARLGELKSEKVLIVEKQDSERSEKPRSFRAEWDGGEDEAAPGESGAPPVSSRALLERVQAQQRRIAALEAADKGNEHLVSEYEKSLAEVTSLKGQVLKLESTLLEAQMRAAGGGAGGAGGGDDHTERDYWKNYCEMLKEENVQLNLKVSMLESAAPAHSGAHSVHSVHSAHSAAGAHGAHGAHQRINDLEQTVLTLRGLVSRLQSEQRCGLRPAGARSRSPPAHASHNDKIRSQLETYRTEIANLRRSIRDKDQLLERSKEMLKIAAQREDHLLAEGARMRRQLDHCARAHGPRGFLSA